MFRRCLVLLLLCGFCSQTFAGVDVVGIVSQVWVDSGGNLWFRLNNSTADAYCADNWMNNNLYVPAASPSYPFYYGLVLASLTKQIPLDVPNISIFNGSTSCDVTATNYGIMLE